MQQDDLAEKAEREAEAQLAIVRALKQLSHDNRRRVLEAVRHLLRADAAVPGLFDQIAAGMHAKSQLKRLTKD